ncbi:hypothetical protein [Mangrovicoccus ximenensis]|uniref:hypothetical protein n=1 Tax=Mangrovicoccus ximenensis TaxID=1911570 RepID=UPI00137517F7|nr:hypothetical protein [Mangrovicoccus ximenensis]
MLLLDPLDPDSPLALMLKGWGPPLVSIVIGGLFASILFPRWQDRFSRSRAGLDKRMELAECIAAQLARYLTAWRRLIDIARLEAARRAGGAALAEAETARKLGFVADRNAARDELLDLCARAQLYFGEAALREIAGFAAWDESQAAKQLDDLPPIEEWRTWERRVLGAMRRDLGISPR